MANLTASTARSGIPTLRRSPSVAAVRAALHGAPAAKLLRQA